MRRLAHRILVVFANVAWLLTSIPGLLRFLVAASNVRRTQQRVLMNVLRANRGSDFGRRHRFEAIRTPEQLGRVPLSDYDDYREDINDIRRHRAPSLTTEPVICLAPTSGSTAATKLIPYTRTLLRQLRAGIDPWIANLYIQYPSLLSGKQYWSISPNTPPPIEEDDAVPVGFASDTEYLSPLQRRLAQSLFAVPPEISQVEDAGAFEFLTCLFLLRERNLRLISVWHPSFLTILMACVRDNFSGLVENIRTGEIPRDLVLPPSLRGFFASRLSPDPKRADELTGIDPAVGDLSRIWPHLTVISCWADGTANAWTRKISRLFPRAVIQPKGLVATEGIVSFPIGNRGRRACSIGSHFFEFVETRTGQRKFAWQLRLGQQYRVVVTTGGGLYRYQLHDLVQVDGFLLRLPCLNFVSKTEYFSDIVGEKLHVAHVHEAIEHLESETGIALGFAMISPTVADGEIRYVLHAHVPGDKPLDCGRAIEILERRLCRNYHYHHARQLGQLQPVGIRLVGEDAEQAYVNRCVKEGMRRGDVKIQRLRRETDWQETLAHA
jgi:hypothetical protein